MSINIENYTARIACATPLQLTIINYEIAIHYINDTLDALNNNNKDLIKKSSQKAVKCVEELINSLNMDYEISQSLMPLYIYVNKILNGVVIKKNIESVKTTKTILTNLLESWNEAEKNIDINNTFSVLNASQKLYAGLTYKNGKLEEYIDDNNSNDYKA